MHFFRNFIYLILCTFGVLATTLAQITITASDLTTSHTNAAYMTQGDTLSADLNLGNSSDGQTWDFSFISFHPATTQRETTNYVAPGGYPEASAFSNANLCSPAVINFVDSIWTVHFVFASYVQVTSDGVYLLGGGAHGVTTPPPPAGFPFPNDSTWAIFPSSPQLIFPLPLSGNSPVATSYHDTTYDPLTVGKYQVQFHRYVPAGSGTMKVPGGATLSVVRMLQTDSLYEYSPGNSPTLSYNFYVVFAATEGSQMKFQINNPAYTSGSVVPEGYQWQTNIGHVLGVPVRQRNLPQTFRLEQNYPNPFNPTTRIDYDLLREGWVTLRVYNALGQVVRTLVDEREEAGRKSVTFDAGSSAIPSGIYFYRLAAGGITSVKKMTLIK